MKGIIDGDKWSSSVSGMLVDIGFFEYLNTELPDTHMSDPPPLNTKMLQIITGNQSITEKIDKLNRGLEQLRNSVIKQPLRHAVFNGLTEAMDNCANHAYPRGHQFVYPVIPGCWWMSGSVTNSQDLEVIFFDQGATIPVTLPNSTNFEKIVQWFQHKFSIPLHKAHDGQRIQAAMAIGRSSDDTSGRGNGLATMKNLVDQAAEQSSLQILSRRGKYVYTKGRNERVESLDFSIGGTLIHWRLYL
ncbi:MAG: hypothetical protein OXE94_01920 [Aestuariivita sp.]|nr:hypothetical protein [Aestuariivita sp.]MCY4202960.1 hypothetical protein [Aestuariivita sp.]